MPVIFPGSTPIDIDTARINLNQTSGDVRYLMSLTGNLQADAFSDWRDVNFYGDVYLEQADGYIWDGCSGRDHWGWYEGTTEYGGYLGAFGGGSTYNSERGYNNGTFLTFGYGYSSSRLRPYTNVMVASSSSGTSCIPFRLDIWEFEGAVVRAEYNLPSSPGNREIRWNFTIGFQQGRSFKTRLLAV